MVGKTDQSKGTLLPSLLNYSTFFSAASGWKLGQFTCVVKRQMKNGATNSVTYIRPYLHNETLGDMPIVVTVQVKCPAVSNSTTTTLTALHCS